MRRLAKIATLMTLVAAATLGPSHRARASFETNLIVNGGAEAGTGSSTGNDVLAVPGWTTVGNFTVVQYGAPGGYPSATDPGPANRGANFFAGGPNNASSSASQTINESADAAAIDRGGVSFDLAGYLGGYINQRDNAVLTVTFLSGSNATLGSASIGPVTVGDRSSATGLLLRTTSGLVPVGTRSIGVTLQMTRLDGDYNDGYADNLSLILHSSAVPEPSSLVTLALGALSLGAYRWSSGGRRRARGR